MKQITLNIPDNKFSFFLQLINSLSFVQVATTENYNPEFVDKVLKSKKEHDEGNFVSIEKENLKDFLELK